MLNLKKSMYSAHKKMITLIGVSIKKNGICCRNKRAMYVTHRWQTVNHQSKALVASGRTLSKTI